jgi:hypothetical protein
MRHHLLSVRGNPFLREEKRFLALLPERTELLAGETPAPRSQKSIEATGFWPVTSKFKPVYRIIGLSNSRHNEPAFLHKEEWE